MTQAIDVCALITSYLWMMAIVVRKVSDDPNYRCFCSDSFILVFWMIAIAVRKKSHDPG